jgi:hypothetical protein
MLHYVVIDYCWASVKYHNIWVNQTVVFEYVVIDLFYFSYIASGGL